MILSVSFYSYHFVRAILSIPFCPMIFCPYTIFSICTILSVPFCPLPFCPRTFGVLMKVFDLLYAYINLFHWKLAQVTMYVVNHNAYSTSKCLQTPQEQLLHTVVSFPVPKGIRHHIRECIPSSILCHSHCCNKVKE